MTICPHTTVAGPAAYPTMRMGLGGPSDARADGRGVAVSTPRGELSRYSQPE